MNTQIITKTNKVIHKLNYKIIPVKWKTIMMIKVIPLIKLMIRMRENSITNNKFKY